MDHAQLLIEIWRLDSGRHVPLSIVDVDVPSDEERLGELDQLHRDEQGNRHHIREKKDPSEESLEEHAEILVPLPLAVYSGIVLEL